MAATDSPGRQPRAANRPVDADGFGGVGAARRRKPTMRAEERADAASVDPDHGEQHDGDRVAGPPAGAHAETRCCLAARSSAASRSAARPAFDADAAGGSTRTTTRVPGTNCSRRVDIRCRNRRLTALRATALPTARLTTNPTCGAAVESAGPGSTCTTRDGRVPRRPCRTTAVKSGRRRSRDAAGNTGGRVRVVRRRAPDGPSDDGRRGSRARREYACATGNRASWHADGCSADRCACSLGGSQALVHADSLV
jgi:hypothetical protein